MPEGNVEKQARNSNLYRNKFALGRMASAGDLAEAISLRKRKEREADSELRLARVKKEREVFKKSKLLTRSPIKQEEMEVLLNKLAEIDTRIKEECSKVGNTVGELKEVGRKERDELKKMWEEDKKQIYNRIEGLEDRLERLVKDASNNVEMTMDGEEVGRKRGQLTN